MKPMESNPNLINNSDAQKQEAVLHLKDTEMKGLLSNLFLSW